MKGTFALMAGGLMALLASAVLQAQVVAPTQPLRITVDVARFRGGDDKHAFIEVYYAFARNALTFSPDTRGLLGRAGHHAPGRPARFDGARRPVARASGRVVRRRRIRPW